MAIDLKVTRDRMEEALQHLAETDTPCAKKKEAVERAAFKAKKVKAAIFLHSQGTVAERNALAEDSHEYEEAMEEYFTRLGDHGAMQNKRASDGIVIDVWRSLNSSMNKGNIV